ncbi:MAG: methyl-accepting chemotaxis protein [Micrococcales bacterium]|nr:methyl-accepting chemotaxis protein [Micrococcales bacterium]MCL2667953.1 methyl-accepting chemotaxis protein [Micrococcales bacterium]
MAQEAVLDAVRRRNDQMGLAVEDLSESVAAISGAAQEAVGSATQAAQATDHVAGAAASVSAAAEQLEASMREVASTSSSSLREATHAGETMSDVLERVSHLNESADQISSVVSTVSRISSQTRMLALNATIEAARAGEAGRGFAVVAAEVKELAGQTGEATVEITQRLESLATDTAAVSGAVDSISEVLARIEELQQTIAAAVEEQTTAIGEFNRSATASASAAAELGMSVAASAHAAQVVTEAVVRSRTWLDRVQDSVGGQTTDIDALTEDIPRGPLEAAIVAHAAWKARLRQAIATGRVPDGFTVEQTRRDDVCPFGRWLHAGEGAAMDAARNAEVMAGHAQFHEAAAGVLAEVSAGRIDQARHALSDPDGYAGVARTLTDALVSWTQAQAGR